MNKIACRKNYQLVSEARNEVVDVDKMIYDALIEATSEIKDHNAVVGVVDRVSEELGANRFAIQSRLSRAVRAHERYLQIFCVLAARDFTELLGYTPKQPWTPKAG